MVKQVARYSYWIGLVCMAISVVWRAVMMVPHTIPEQVGPVWYSSFWKAGAIFLLVSIASVGYAWLHGQEKPAEKRAEKTFARAA